MLQMDPEDLLTSLFNRVQGACRSFDRLPAGSRLAFQLEGPLRMVTYVDAEWTVPAKTLSLRLTRQVREELDWLGESFVSEFAVDQIEDNLYGLMDDLLGYAKTRICEWYLDCDLGTLLAMNQLELAQRRVRNSLARRALLRNSPESKA